MHRTSGHSLLWGACSYEQKDRAGRCKGGKAEVQEVGLKYLVSQQEVPPLHYTLQPAGQTGGGQHPGRRSPGGEGGEMVLKLFF